MILLVEMVAKIILKCLSALNREQLCLNNDHSPIGTIPKFLFQLMITGIQR